MTEPIVCSLEPGELRVRRDALLPGIAGQAEHIEPIDGGVRLRFADATLLTTVGAVGVGGAGGGGRGAFLCVSFFLFFSRPRGGGGGKVFPSRSRVRPARRS